MDSKVWIGMPQLSSKRSDLIEWKDKLANKFVQSKPSDNIELFDIIFDLSPEDLEFSIGMVGLRVATQNRIRAAKQGNARRRIT